MNSINRRIGFLVPVLALSWLAACGGSDDRTIGLNSKPTPFHVPLAQAAASVSAGWAHTYAVLADGSAACWGGNQFGQLGHGGQAFVCNIGDMLERATGGYYRSTPHRVRLNASGRDRLSFPLFLDPDFDARIEPLRTPEREHDDDAALRWDGASGHAFEGTYGDHVLAKVGKVFPALRDEVL